MAKVGHFVFDPMKGVYCQMTLDSGEEILVSRDGVIWRTIKVLEVLGFRGASILACDLDSPEGKAALARVSGHGPTATEGAPLGAFVNYFKDSHSVADVRTKCAALMLGV